MDHFVNIHAHTKSRLQQNYELVNVELFMPINESNSTIGIHPWRINKINVNESLQWVEKTLMLSNVVALGEIGLDRVIDINIESQKTIFISQHKFAEQVNKPIIIHCVKAYSDFLELHKKLKPKVKWILHGFKSNINIASEFIKKGCYLSFGEALLFSEKVQVVFSELPLSNIFLETDDSDLKIEQVYEKAANLHHICIDELKQQIHSNYMNVFEEQWSKTG